MKRYYSIDFVAMKEANLNPTKWMICENIHFTQAITESGYCEHSRTETALHHDISTSAFKKIISQLVEDGFLKRNSKNNLKTTPKWHKLGGIKNDTEGYQKGYARGIKNDTILPIRENKERVSENTHLTDMDFRLLITKLGAKTKNKAKIPLNLKQQEEAYTAYQDIKDKTNLLQDYLAHQDECISKGEPQFIQKFTTYMQGYNLTKNSNSDNPMSRFML